MILNCGREQPIKLARHMYRKFHLIEVVRACDWARRRDELVSDLFKTESELQTLLEPIARPKDKLSRSKYKYKYHKTVVAHTLRREQDYTLLLSSCGG